ncbi:hypothetical protein ACHAQH_004781 [Verticillium albo-atrum]
MGVDINQESDSSALSSAPSSPLSNPPDSEFEPGTPSPTRHKPSQPVAVAVAGPIASPQHSHDPTASTQEEITDGSATAKEKKTARKAQLKGYPEGITRLTRFGKGTYAAGHGPLPDDVDWTEMPLPVVKEQLFMRGVSNTWVATPEVELGLTHKSAFEVDDGIAAQHRPGGYRKGANERTHASVKKALDKRMILVKRRDASGWDDWNTTGSDNVKSADFYLRSSDKTYCITIDEAPKCECAAKNHCKHIIYVLVHVLRAPEALIHQNRFLQDEIRSLLTRGPNLRPTMAQIDNDPTMKDGIPKDKIAQDCPVCYQVLGDDSSVVCATCGRHAHESCHKIWEHENSGWGPLKCATCQSIWK